MNQIFPDNAHKTRRKYVSHIQSKYKLFTSITETHRWQKNLVETHIQFYKNAKNDILYMYGDPRYMLQYALLPWVGTSNFMDEHEHGGYFSYRDTFNTTPDLIQYIHYTLW